MHRVLWLVRARDSRRGIKLRSDLFFRNLLAASRSKVFAFDLTVFLRFRIGVVDVSRFPPVCELKNQMLVVDPCPLPSSDSFPISCFDYHILTEHIHKAKNNGRKPRFSLFVIRRMASRDLPQFIP